MFWSLIAAVLSRKIGWLQLQPALAAVLAETSAPLRLDYIQRNPAFGFAVDFEFEVVVARALKMKTEMLPDVNVRLRLVTGNLNLKILAYRLENRPHIRIAEVHLDPMAAFLADIKS